jgi:hypothetical protein
MSSQKNDKFLVTVLFVAITAIFVGGFLSGIF